MPRSFAVEPDCSNGKKQLSIAHFLTRRPSSDAVHSPKRHCAAPVSPHGRLSPRAVHSPASPRSSPLPHTSRASPRGLVQQSSSPNTAGFRSPRTVNVDREGPPQPSPRGTGAGSSIVRALPRKNTVQSSSNSDDKIRTPRGRPLDYNMQMILVREDTIPELMDKLQFVEAADLGCDEFSEDDGKIVHVSVKGSVATGRTRIIKGVELHKTFEPPSHYIRTRENVDATQTTEYDMDSEDCRFVQKYNEACEDGKEVTSNVFEIFIDRLEKELMIRLEASQGGGHSSSERLGVRGLSSSVDHVTIDEAVCAVCQYDDSYEDNLIIVCDGCDVAVHQVCYGVKKVPAGPWLCDPCSQGQRRNPKPPAPTCCLCHKKGGAFKITDDGRWAHIMCAIWIPQTCVQNNETMCPIVGIDRVPLETWQMLCDFCLCQGACIRCSEPGCMRVFHPVCARSNGCVMDIGEGDLGEIDYRATCPQHSEFTGCSASSFAFERRSKEVVLEPQTIRDLVPIQKVFNAFQFKPHIVRSLYDYWVEKRARCSGSLLARFYTFPEGYFNSYRDEKTRKTNVITLMKKAIKLREEWESLRILLDVVRQREKRKLALLKLQQEIVEEEVAVGWRIVQKTRISVAAKWKVRPIKLEAVRAHHNFRSSSGSESDQEEEDENSSRDSCSSSVMSERDVEESDGSSSSFQSSDDESSPSSSVNSNSSREHDDASELDTRGETDNVEFGKARSGSKNRSLRGSRAAQVLKSMQRCAAWILRSTGIKTKKLSERMLAGYGRGCRGGARGEWCRLCSAVVHFKLGTAVKGTEGLESGFITLAPGVTLGSLKQFQFPRSSLSSSSSSFEQASSSCGAEKLADSYCGGSNEDSDVVDGSLELCVKSGKRQTRSEAGKVSLELRGLGVRDGRAARLLASDDVRPSRFCKRQKHAGQQ